MSDDARAWSPRILRTGRLEAFSDGVFAIAITILVLEISVPPGSEGHLLHAVGHLWPEYLAYVVSFATIGAMWLGHSTMTEYMQASDSVFGRINLLFLMAVSFLPFPTKLLAESLTSTDAERVAATIYGLNLLFVSITLSLLWRYANRADLVRPEADDQDVQWLARRLTPGLGGYLLLLVLGLLFPLVAVFGYLALAFALLVPIRSRRTRSTGAARPTP